MNNNYKWTFQKYAGQSTRHTCPKCGSKKSFTRMHNVNDSSLFLPDHVGRCNREEKCGYQYTAGDYFREGGTAFTNHLDDIVQAPVTKLITPDFIPKNILIDSFEGFQHSNFFFHLRKIFSYTRAKEVCEKYQIGITENRDAIFWLIDIDGIIRTGKVIQFPKDEFHKKGTYFLHKQYKKNFNLQQIPFGSHLTSIPQNLEKPICVVESEKTAVVASLFLPANLWISVGSVNNLRQLGHLKNREFVLYPDKGEAFNNWITKAKEMKLQFTMDKTVENSNLEEGSDFADYLLNELKSPVVQ